MENVFQNKDTIFKYHRNKDGTVVPPKIFLCTRTLKKIGLIHPVSDLKIETKFNEANTCSFTIYKNNNGIEMPNFQRVKNLSVIQIEGFGLFEIQVTVTEDDAVCKRITGTALQESELSQTYCTLEINTENDFNITGTDSNENYPTLFYRDLSTSSSESEQEKIAGSSLLHRILSYAPTYTIGHVDNSLMGINREFSCSNSTVYDFLQEIAEEVGCIFIFDPMSRKINAYDLEDHCLKCGGRHIIHGVCQACQDNGEIEHGYGLDTTIYVDTHTIAESIEDSVDVDSVKNCFKLVAGDDETTNRLGQRLIGGSNYIWTFGEEQLAEFSDSLREKWLKYPDYVNGFQADFNQCWDEYNEKVDEILDLQSGKMPTTELNAGDTDPAGKCEEIYETIKEKIPHYVIGTMNAVPSTVAGNILKFANFLCPPGYKVEFQTDEQGNKRFHCETEKINNINVITKFKCYLYIYLMDCKDENQKDRYYYKSDKEWEIDVKPGYNKMDGSTTFSHDYYLYLKQMMDYKMASLDVTFDPKYDTDYTDGKDHAGEVDYYKKYFLEYSINRLTSFKDAYDTCIEILFELDADLATNEIQQKYKYIVNDDGKKSSQTMYGKLTEKYTAFSEYISGVISEYTEEVEAATEEKEKLWKKIEEINQKCNIKTYLGEDLYQELISFKREQVYENRNFTSNVTDEATLMNNVEEFILRAKEEIAKSCQFQHSVPISMSNLLTLADFEKVFDVFALGNYIRTRINGELVKFRIISIPFDFEHIEQCEFTFSDALVGNQALKDFQKKTQKAQSLATSFDYVQRQSTANDEKISSFTEMFREGLDATKTLIMSADDVSTVMDNHGILTRRLNLDTGDYYPEQLRITNGTIGYTDDDWKTIKAAFGRFYWNDAYRYGLIGECIVGKLLAGEQLTIENEEGSVKITGDGITLDGGAIRWEGSTSPVNNVEVYYMKTEEPTPEPKSNNSKWNKSLPSMTDGKYLWQKTVTTDCAGNIDINIACIGEVDNISSIKTQYYESTSMSNVMGGSWSDNIPVYTSGSGITKYIWTRDYITYKSGSYTTTNEIYNSALTNSIYGYGSFKDKVNKALKGSATTEIGADYVISPKIGGGYLYITNNDYSVEIDPTHGGANNTLDGYLFCIREKDNDHRILSVDTNGNGYFKGTIYATSGEFTGKITATSIAGSTIEGSTITCGDNFEVDEKGNVIAKAINIEGGNIHLETQNGGEGFISFKNYIYDLVGDSNFKEEIKYFPNTKAIDVEEWENEGIPIEDGALYMMLQSGDIYKCSGSQTWNKITNAQAKNIKWQISTLNTAEGLICCRFENSLHSGSTMMTDGRKITYSGDAIKFERTLWTGSATNKSKTANISAELSEFTGYMYDNFNIKLVSDTAFQTPELITDKLIANNYYFGDYKLVLNSFVVDLSFMHTSRPGNNNQVQLATGEIIDALIDSNYITISTPGICGSFPAFACNGDADAHSNMNVVSVQVFPNSQKLRINFSESTPGAVNLVRFSYGYWAKI